MQIDGITLSVVIRELNNAISGYKIEKIFSPTFDSIAVHLCRCGLGYLFASCSRNNSRIHLKSDSIPNPPEPPPFCMVLRKHFVGGKVLSIVQHGLERIVDIELEGWADEEGSSHKRIVIEMMGPKSNMILVDSDGTIVDCIYKTDRNSNARREMASGCQYIRPDALDRLDPFECSIDEFSSSVKRAAIRAAHSDGNETSKKRGFDTVKAFLTRYMLGVGDVTAEHVMYVSGIQPTKLLTQINEDEISAIWNCIRALKDKIDIGSLTFSVGYDAKDTPVVFSIFGLDHYEYDKTVDKVKVFNSANQMIDAFYSGSEESELVEREKSKLSHKLKVLLERACRKANAQEAELLMADEADTYKRLGDLVISNTHLYHGKLNTLKKNAKGNVEVTLTDYFSSEMEDVVLELDPSMTMSENAQLFFKKYAKAVRAKSSITQNLSRTRDEIAYLESVSEALEHADSKLQVSDISGELVSLGYLRPDKSGKKKSKETHSMPTKYTFKAHNGIEYEIYVGRNNTQNDHLTLKLARNNDLWMHVKEMPGSHVIIRSQGMEIPDEVVQAGAVLAAYYSKGRLSSNVAVDYTLRKYVHKPNGAKPGMVIYESQSTVWATPSHENLKSLFGKAELQ